MTTDIRSPLVEVFLKGDVERDVRLLAARGAFAPRARDQMTLLMMLVSDLDTDIAATAAATLDTIDREILASFLASSEATEELRAYFATRGIEPGPVARPDAERPLVVGEGDVAEPDEAAQADSENESVQQRLTKMTVPDKARLAMRGSREERGILIRDSNKLVSTSVLSSPKITESEIESIARMTSVSDEILRTIARTRAWVKSYAVAAALVRNPKTPLAISLNLLGRLSDRDLRTLATNRNIPEVLRLNARKKLVTSKP